MSTIIRYAAGGFSVRNSCVNCTHCEVQIFSKIDGDASDEEANKVREVEQKEYDALPWYKKISANNPGDTPVSWSRSDTLVNGKIFDFYCYYNPGEPNLRGSVFLSAHSLDTPIEELTALPPRCPCYDESISEVGEKNKI